MEQELSAQSGLYLSRGESGQGKRPEGSSKLRGVEKELSIPRNFDTMLVCVYMTPSWKEASSERWGKERGTAFRSTPR